MKHDLALVNKDAALVVKDIEAGEKLVDAAITLASDTGKQKELKNNIAKLARPDATDDIVKELFKLIQCN